MKFIIKSLILVLLFSCSKNENQQVDNQQVSSGDYSTKGVFLYSVVFLFFPFGIWSIAPVFALPLLAGFLFKRAAEYFDDKALEIRINEEE